MITGSGLARLKGMAWLNVLNLNNCRLVDSDLQYFLSMPNLRIVFVGGSAISTKAVEDLRKQFTELAVSP
jgi:hypothetical protein